MLGSYRALDAHRDGSASGEHPTSVLIVCLLSLTSLRSRMRFSAVSASISVFIVVMFCEQWIPLRLSCTSERSGKFSSAQGDGSQTDFDFSRNNEGLSTLWTEPPPACSVVLLGSTTRTSTQSILSTSTTSTGQATIQSSTSSSHHRSQRRRRPHLSLVSNFNKSQDTV